MRLSAQQKAEHAHFERMVQDEVERRLSERWMKGSELVKHFACCTKDWLKEHGSELPRQMVGNAWLYNFAGVREELIVKGKFKIKKI